jgi:bifunctional non-homologous end joining protein LigD
MSLKTYHQKRNFKVTPEPKGKAAAGHKKGLQYVIQKHDASRLHYDFRLELEGTLKSWAVPKGPSLDPGKKSLAVHVEDHPIDYGDFEGVIPKGQYGGGTVLLWDRGTWEPVGDPVEEYRAGKLHFILHGEKLKGEWSLVRMGGSAGGDGKNGGKNWLLIKSRDKYASTTRDILEDSPRSVKSKRTLQRIEEDREDVWSDEAKETAKLEKAKKSAMPTTLSPQLAMLAEHPPMGDQWIHEVKFDGYRVLAFIKAGKVKLLTRRGLDWTAKFAGIARALEKLKADSAIVDGEAVVLDGAGRSDFQALQSSMKDGRGAPAVYFAFDLPFCDGVDLREVPLVERKERLEKLLKESKLGPRINYSDHVRGEGEGVIEKACGMGLEGIVSKKADSSYVSRREPTWVKSKCGNRQEFIIIGYTDPQGSRTGFGSLLLGYHDDKGRLVYGGRVGTGFDEKGLRELGARLKKLGQDDPPTDVAPPRRERSGAHWVKPELVGEVRFTAWTRDGVLRHPAFIALRLDKEPGKIAREKPVEPKKLERLANEGARNSAPTLTLPRSTGRGDNSGGGGKKGTRANVSAERDDSQVAGVRLTHPEKELYPEEHITKRDVVEYYKAVQEWMLPHVVGRPLALLRCPEGLKEKCFFQRNWSENMPGAIGKIDVRGKGKHERHVTIRDLAGVISLVQMSVLEIHCWNCTNEDVEHPDQLIFDLDPGPDLAWNRVIEGARAVKRMLDSLKLPSFLKTTGGKGLHVVIPIEPGIDWASAKSFCKTIAEALSQDSKEFVANMRKDLRGGKIYIDYNRNDHFATAVAAYSTRGRAGAGVSMPLSWNDLGKLKSAAQFTVENAAEHCRKRKNDPWADFEKSRVDLRKAIEKRSGN